MRTIIKALFILIFSSNLNAFNNILNLDKEINFRPNNIEWATFIVSTESSLKSAENIFKEAQKNGLFISVGSERAFYGASLAQNISHALFIDYDPKIVKFNRINIELLKARSIKEYKFLRYEAEYTKWQEFIAKNKRYKINLKEEDYNWWKENVRDITKVGNVRIDLINRYGYDFFYENFLKLSKKLDKLDENEKAWWQDYILDPKFFTMTYGQKWAENPSKAFDFTSFKDIKSDSYLFDKKLFNNLHKLAIKNRMATCVFDIRNKEHIQKLKNAIIKAKLIVSIMDLDNTYMSGYIGKSNDYNQFLNSMLPLGKDNSIVLAMIFGSAFESYFGFTFENIKKWPTNYHLNNLSKIDQTTLQLLDGRLYKKSDLPRWNSNH